MRSAEGVPASRLAHVDDGEGAPRVVEGRPPGSPGPGPAHEMTLSVTG